MEVKTFVEPVRKYDQGGIDKTLSLLDKAVNEQLAQASGRSIIEINDTVYPGSLEHSDNARIARRVIFNK